MVMLFASTKNLMCEFARCIGIVKYPPRSSFSLPSSIVDFLSTHHCIAFHISDTRVIRLQTVQKGFDLSFYTERIKLSVWRSPSPPAPCSLRVLGHSLFPRQEQPRNCRPPLCLPKVTMRNLFWTNGVGELAEKWITTTLELERMQRRATICILVFFAFGCDVCIEFVGWIHSKILITLSIHSKSMKLACCNHDGSWLLFLLRYWI